MTRRLRRVIAVLAVVGAVTSVWATAGPRLRPADAYLGAPWFEPGTVYDQNFPDPHVLFDDGVFYAYATNTGGPQLPAMVSADMRTWWVRDAWSPNPWNSDPFYADSLVDAPNWAATLGGQAEVWAPMVLEHGGRWLAYLTVRESHGSQPRYCISVAVGPGPLGPFVDDSAEPITCGISRAGAIDPWVYVDGAGTPWLLWKTEPAKAQGYLPALPAAIWSRELHPSGLGFAEDSAATILLTGRHGTWEGGIVESPAMFTKDGRLHLVYSGNRFGSPDYATGWATCDTPAGPCRRAVSGPILAKNATDNGPGGASVFVDGYGDHHIAYHAWNAPFASYPVYPSCDHDGDGHCVEGGQRFMHVDHLCTIDGRLRVGLPDGWPFCDVDGAAWFGAPIRWTTSVGVTGGVSTQRFAPDRTITRAEAVTMLWRWAGAPTPAEPSPFVDVDPAAFYGEAVAWASQTGLVVGTSPDTFDPGAPAQRAHIAVILHRAAGSPATGFRQGAANFDDVPPDAYHASAVEFLTALDVIRGAEPGIFAPTRPASRAHLATMLCRFTTIASATAFSGDGVVPPAVPAGDCEA